MPIVAAPATVVPGLLLAFPAVVAGVLVVRDDGAGIEAIARRSRLSLEAPAPVALGTATLEQLGLTPREAEVLAAWHAHNRKS